MKQSQAPEQQSQQAAEQAKLESLIDSLLPELQPVVAQIESDKMPTTKGHYGDYMSLISGIAKGQKSVAQLIALTLIRAGANKDGVAAALRLSI